MCVDAVVVVFEEKVSINKRTVGEVVPRSCSLLTTFLKKKVHRGVWR